MIRSSFEKMVSKPVAADGGWATELRARGFASSAPVELANVEKPRLVLELSREYLEAGACLLTTNTFAVLRLVVQRPAGAADPGELAALGARLAVQAIESYQASRRARSQCPLVVGSIGPSGQMLLVREMGEAELATAFARQATALVQGGADALLLETFSELEEILLALRAVKAAVPGLAVIASMSFDSGPQRTRTVMGTEAAAFAAAASEAGAAAVGSNCGAGIAAALPAVVALRANTALPVWVKPSTGLPDLEDGKPVYHCTPDEFAAVVPDLIKAGASVIGGCCGTGPAHVRRIAALLSASPRKRGG